MRCVPLLAASLLVVPGLPAQDRREMTVEWIHGDEAAEVTKLPSTYWTSEGEVLLLDERGPAAARTLDRVRPGLGTREAAVDARAALSSLRSLLGETEAPETLGWPAGFDAAGRRAVYVFGDDLYLLDLPASRFERLTRTDAREEIPRLSPDGGKLAFVRGNDLHLLDLGARTETRLTADGRETVRNGSLSWLYWEEIFDRNEEGYWWSPDSSALAFLRTDESPVDVVSFVDFAPAVPRVVHQRYPKAGGANPAVRLGVVAADGPRTISWVDPSEVPYEYLLRVEWAPDGARLAYVTLNRRQDRSEVHLLDRASGASRRVVVETDAAWVNTPEVAFAAGGRELLVTSERTGQTHVYRYTLEGVLLNAVTGGPWSVRGPADFTASALGAFVVDDRREAVYFTGLEKSPRERHLYRVGLDGTGLARLSAEAGSHHVTWSPDRRHYLDDFSSRSVPPSLTLRDAEGSARLVLAPPRTDVLAPFGLRPPKPLSIPAADGFPLPAEILEPAGFDPKRRYPLIVHVYGEPNAPLVVDAWDSRRYFDQVLLDRGYLVARVDPRSATGSGKAAQATVLRRKNGDVELGDLVAAVRWLKSRPGVDPDRVGIWGWSGGGTYTLLGLTRSREFKAGIAVAPETERRYYDTKYVEAYMKTPAENPEGYDEVSLVKRAGDLHGRLLLVFGTGDDNVHPQNSLHFADALIAAGKPFDMMAYPMRKHGIEDPPARRHLFEKMLEFWDRHL